MMLLRLAFARRVFERYEAARRAKRFDLASVPIDEERREMRPIVFATGSLGVGGSERQLALTALGVNSRLTCDVRVIALQQLDGTNGFFASRLHAAGIAIDADILADLSVPTNLISTRPFLAINAILTDGALEVGNTIWAFACQFARHRPAVVHAWLDEVNVTAGVAAALCGVPRIVLACRSVAPVHFKFYQSYMGPIYRELLRLPNVVITNNSTAGARDYADWLEVEPERILIVRNGLDIDDVPVVSPQAVLDFRTVHGLGDAPVVVMLGRMSEEKRPLFWLQIARRLLDLMPDVKFVWAGDGPMREAVRQRAADLALTDSLIMPGVQSDSATVLAAGNVFLLTSRAEGLPNVLIEAQRYGMPVVSAKVGGAAEAIIENVTGISVPPDDVDGFVRAILHFLNNPDAIKTARSRGPRFVADQFSLERMIDRTIAIYRSARPMQ